jgi:hypothetical protein
MRESSHRRGNIRAAIEWCKSDRFLLLLVTLAALLARLPYWRTIPAAGDEVGQAIYAFKIAQGHGFPLVGNDAYAGPFFFYLVAFLFRLGISDPLIGRTIVLIAGTLTATLTYAWARQLGGGRIAALTAALLVACNPHLILLNGHVGGTTFLLPFFTTLFLWSLSRAIDADSYGWLAASAVAAGLALQSNPVSGLLVAGGLVWLVLRTRGAPRLGRYWPLVSIIGGLCVLAVYSPVIIYNATTGLGSVSTVGERSYLWQAEPSIRTFLTNSVRLVLQLVRQVGGVLVGEETFGTLVGMPLVYMVWMLAGLSFITCRVSKLPLLTVLPFLLVFPYLSGHYGLIVPVRFTSLLTPVFAVGMGMVLAAALKRFAGLAKRWAAIVGLACGVMLAVFPLIALFQYYAWVEENQLGGQILLDLSRHIVEVNQGEPVYVSSTPRMMHVHGIPYVPHAYMLLAGIRQEFLPPEQILGRLYESSDGAFLLVTDDDATMLQQSATLIPWDGAANEKAHLRGYGLYTLDTEKPLIKPDFVLEGEPAQRAAPQATTGAVLGGQIELIGYDVLGEPWPGGVVELAVYWRALGSAPGGIYVGFVHLLDASGALAAQDDHVLGQDRYPVGAWQRDEIVIDRYLLPVPEDASPGEYTLWAGIYTWPDLVRLEVVEHPDDIVELGAFDVGCKD